MRMGVGGGVTGFRVVAIDKSLVGANGGGGAIGARQTYVPKKQYTTHENKTLASSS